MHINRIYTGTKKIALLPCSPWTVHHPTCTPGSPWPGLWAGGCVSALIRYCDNHNNNQNNTDTTPREFNRRRKSNTNSTDIKKSFQKLLQFIANSNV